MAFVVVVVVATNSASAQGLGGQPMFSAPQSWLEPISTGGGKSPVAADLNSDGLLDVVYSAGPAPRARLNLGSGNFGAPTILNLVGAPSSVVLGNFSPAGSGDFNFDGFLDLVFVEGITVRNVWVGLAQPTAALNYTLVYFPDSGAGATFNPVEHVTVADLDVDGTPELLVVATAFAQATGFYDVLRVFRWDVVSGAFVLAFSHTVATDRCFSTCVGDFNGDGFQDIGYETGLTSVTGTGPLASPAQMHVLLGSGGFSFAPGGSLLFPTVTLPGLQIFTFAMATAAGDVDADGFDDVVGIGFDYAALGLPAGLAYVFRGSPTGLTAPYYVTAQGSGHWHRFMRTRTSLADIDGDGFLDLIGWHGIARLWPQNVTGTVVDPTGGGPYAGPGGVTGFHESQIAADFDGDGDLDMFVPFSAPFGAIGSFYTAIAWNQTRLRYGCAGGFSPPPVISTGTLYLGNPAYEVRIDGAPPNALCVFGIATAAGYQPFPPCVVGLDLSTLIQPTLSGLGFSVTNASGSASQYFAIPALPALQFAAYYGQWIVVDPGGQLSAGPLTYNLTETRKFVFW